jgi:universal stress protein A
MPEYRRILVALDLSPASQTVALRAKSLAEELGAEMTLLHVFEYIPPLDLADSPLGSTGWAIDEKELVELHKRHLAELAERVGLAGRNRELLVGLAKTEIIGYAQEHQIDLIIMGSHGRHGIGRLLGSTTHAVLNNATCDVLAVRIAE